MRKFFRLILLLLVVSMPLASCGSSAKARKIRKKRTVLINTTQLGKNRYFFSKKYQRKLHRTRKKRR